MTTKWVFETKRTKIGGVGRFKARLVARGFEQREGRDNGETFAPVSSMNSIRILIALAVINRQAIEQFYVATAFLNGRIEEDIYLEPPKGLTVGSGRCLKLHKALYGLKQAPKAWFTVFESGMSTLGFKQAEKDGYVYTNDETNCKLAIYVDDRLVIGPLQGICRQIIEQLNAHFTTKRIDSSVF